MEEPVSWEDLPRFMAEVRVKARSLLRRDPHASLQTTELIDSAVRRLLGTTRREASEATWEDRDHFLGILYLAMEAVLIDHARRRRRLKRDVGRTVTLEDLQWNDPLLAVDETPEQVIALHEVLEQLERQKPAWAAVVKYRLLGLTLDEIAQIKGVSKSTISRTLDDAQHWCDQDLLRGLNEAKGPSPE
jgi:RNA polymerase sigma factor (TIGR02999 family)